MSRPVFAQGYRSSPVLSQKEIQALKILKEAKGLTTRAFAISLSCSLKKASSLLKTLFSCKMIYWVDVLAESNKTPVKFRLWSLSELRPPKNAQEACRLATYGRFYALARKEASGFSWYVLRQNDILVAEMLYTKDGERKRLRIEAPRQNEKPLDWANIHIQCHKDTSARKNSVTVVMDDALINSKSLKELFQTS